MNIVVPMIMWFVETKGQVARYISYIISKRLNDIAADEKDIEKARQTAVLNHIIKKYFY